MAELGEKVEKAANAGRKITEHTLSVEETEKLWKTSVKSGLSTEDAAKAQVEHGKNRLTPPPKKSMCRLFFEHLTGFFSLLLWAASILCFIAYGLKNEDVENLYLGIVLAFVVVMTGIFSFYQDYQSAAVMEGFANFLPPQSNVIRNGEAVGVPSEDLVPGDIVLIGTGDKIPADIRVVEAKSFKVNNSSLTGEPDLQARRPDGNTYEQPLEATNLAFYGTQCETGNATGIVIAIGDNTVIGDIANVTAGASSGDTPIAKEIHHFIIIVSTVAIVLGVTFLIIGFVMGLEPIANLVFAIGIIVANVPEGLLATVTVSLTLTAKRMASKKVLVKNLEAVETLGSTTVIASDKTGTLTMNIMTVVELYYNMQIQDVTDMTSLKLDASDAGYQRLKLVAALCSNAKFDKSAANMAKDVQWRETIGDASESALIKYVEKASALEGCPDLEATRAANGRIAEIPFSSANKYQVSINYQDNDQSKPRYLTMKGAPERVIKRCSHLYKDGKTVKITEEMYAQFDKDIASMMAKGERVLGMAFSTLDPKQFPADFEYNVEEPNFPMDGLTFVGTMALEDPPRAAVPGAVLSCQAAGIKVIMVTGDHPETAEAIARKVNIITGRTRKEVAAHRGVPIEQVDVFDADIKAVVITGSFLETLDSKMLDKYLDFPEIVFARTSPKQKLEIVTGLQEKKTMNRAPYSFENPKLIKNVVAVTGDGVNDSPALKKADIGVAMGIAGSDVAKGAADMILLNDNFASIVDGVEEGRLIFDNLKKSIAYTLSSNIPEISPFLVFILIQIPLPLPTVLILCIDLGTDMIPAISLAYEGKESDIMQRPPRDARLDRLVNSKLINFSYLQIGCVQACAGFYTYVVVLMNYGFPPSFLPNHAHWFFKGSNTTHLALTETGVFPLDASATERAPGHWLQYCGQNDAPTACEYELMGKCNLESYGGYHESLCWNAAPTLGALQHAQCAFFIAIIVVQWADLVICKTRTLSVFEQGMNNGTLNFGLFFTTVLGSILCYVPMLDQVFGTAKLAFVHWIPAMPFCIMIFLYDEVRKAVIRQHKGGWVFRNTYY